MKGVNHASCYLDAPPGASAVLDNFTPLAFYFFPVFLAFLVRWIVVQSRKNGWNLFRLLPIASSTLSRMMLDKGGQSP